LGQHLEKQKPRLKPESRIVFGPFASGMTATVKFIDHSYRRLEFATHLTGQDGRLRFGEAMSVLGCCYVATMIGLTFGLSIEPIDAEENKLAFRYRRQAGYVPPQALVLDRTAKRVTIRFKKSDIETRASHAPTGNLEALAGILAALHDLEERETDQGRITWRKKPAQKTIE